MTKYTLFHHFKHKKSLVYIENNPFVGSVEEISAIIKEFPRPWVAWVACFSMSVLETRTGKVETYTGVTGDKFKVRYNQHSSDFETENNRSKTTLAGHIWNMKDQGKPSEVGWSIIDRAKVFNPTTQKCRVCLKEKSHILYNQEHIKQEKQNF